MARAELEELRRTRIIQRADDTLAKLQAKIRQSLDQLAHDDDDAFAEELGDSQPDAEEKALRRAIANHELEEERRRWEEITDISERNRAARPGGE